MSTSLSDIFELFSISRRTPATLRGAIASHDAPAIHEFWNEALRKPRKRFLKRQPVRTLLALWSVDCLELSGRERELAATIEDQLRSDDLQPQSRKNKSRSGRSAKKYNSAEPALYVEVLTNWLVEAAEPLGTWERLAVSEMLLVEHQALSSEVFVRCLALLSTAPIQNSDGTASLPTQLSPGAATSAINATSPLYGAHGGRLTTAAICDSEALWLTSLLLEPLASARHKGTSATDDLTRTLLECTDPEGFLHGALLPQITEFLTPLVRSLIWAEAFQRPLWGTKADTRFQQCIRKAGLSIGNSRRLFPLVETDNTTDSQHEFAIACMQQATRLAGLKPTGKIRRLLDECTEPSDRKQRRQHIKRLCAASADSRKNNTGPSVSCQSDVSSSALMRSQMSSMADLLVAEWHSAMPRLSLDAFGTTVLNGAWRWQLQINGREISPSITWNCTCWFTDNEVVFAELEAQDLNGAKLIRHLLLSVIDHFAILTDSVSCDQPDAEVKWQSSIPLGRCFASERESITRELSLRTDDLGVRAFPIWLPDDRIISTAGELSEQDGCLTAAMTGRGGVTLPLVLDWNPRRRKSPAEWSRLTVSEARRNVSAQEAAGCRIRIGKHQLMVYRSLRKPEIARSVLGLHTADESVYGRVTAGGIVEPLVQVEPTPDNGPPMAWT